MNFLMTSFLVIATVSSAAFSAVLGPELANEEVRVRHKRAISTADEQAIEAANAAKGAAEVAVYALKEVNDALADAENAVDVGVDEAKEEAREAANEADWGANEAERQAAEAEEAANKAGDILAEKEAKLAVNAEQRANDAADNAFQNLLDEGVDPEGNELVPEGINARKKRFIDEPKEQESVDPESSNDDNESVSDNEEDNDNNVWE